ncbi:PAS domain S-box protein [Hymenobacter sp. BT770]|uniref:PAS domain-containing sensor histidine kinase n=1 Tax=Hymenobacter sp. BT770 TaxID=2886942 RepID=UPI001D0F7923|nr:PAS domain S-box protein [Hymenobacter sp. BT770]MCC3155244.1 PAS domain S-box protein [Hymenobacter sp. BT770]MDO3417200.1 PAS domain S-box protein [Hymenobacter sp. BT770]
MAKRSPAPASPGPQPEQVHSLQQQNTRLRQQQADDEQQQAVDQRYARSQDRFRTVFENSPLGQKIIGPDLCIRQANQALATLLGLKSAKKVVGRKIMEFAHPDFVQDWKHLQQELWEHKKPCFVLETCLVRVDKSVFWCRVTSVLFPDEAGELGYTSLEDITARKQAEEERARNLSLLEQAEGMADLGSWDYDLHGQEFRWSEGLYRLFGLPPGQPVHPDIYLRLVVDEDRSRAERLVRCLTAGSTGFEETLRLRVGKQVKTVRLKAVVFHDEVDHSVRVLGVVLDISERQRLEADNLRLRLTQQQALFEAVQAAEENERRRMAEALHNGIGQLLFATKLRLDRLHAPVLHTAPALVKARTEADRLLSEAIRQTRVLSHELIPLILEEFGLEAALKDIGRKLSTPRLRLRSHLTLDEAAAPLPPTLQMALYRMGQELALNIARHATGATEGSLELETMPGWVLLRAEDDGPGFAPAPAGPQGLGLRSIRDRVALLGGQLEIGAGWAGGAYVRIRIPLPVPAAP